MKNETKANNQIHQNSGFAQRLRQLRRQKNLSQTMLAQLADVHYTHIARYESGASKPKTDTLKRLADALGVSSGYLIDDEFDHNSNPHLQDPDLLWQFQEVEKMPEEDKTVIKKLLEAFITKKHLQMLASR